MEINTDDDLDRFARTLAARMEDPSERQAILAGRVRFALRRSHGAEPRQGGRGSSQLPALRVEKGAVTERKVREAAASGVRLVLARGAVLTPLARDQARALGVEIERESRC